MDTLRQRRVATWAEVNCRQDIEALRELARQLASALSAFETDTEPGGSSTAFVARGAAARALHTPSPPTSECERPLVDGRIDAGIGARVE